MPHSEKKVAPKEFAVEDLKYIFLSPKDRKKKPYSRLKYENINRESLKSLYHQINDIHDRVVREEKEKEEEIEQKKEQEKEITPKLKQTFVAKENDKTKQVNQKKQVNDIKVTHINPPQSLPPKPPKTKPKNLLPKSFKFNPQFIHVTMTTKHVSYSIRKYQEFPPNQRRLLSHKQLNQYCGDEDNLKLLVASTTGV